MMAQRGYTHLNANTLTEGYHILFHGDPFENVEGVSGGAIIIFISTNPSDKRATQALQSI